MLTCQRITELATDYAEGHLGAAERGLFEEHVGGCPGCRTWVRQLGVTRQALGALPEPELPVELRAELLRRFDARQAAGAAGRLPRWRALAGGTAVAGAFALLVAVARSPSRAATDWALALALALLAVAFATVVRRLTFAFAAGGAGAAVLAAVVGGGAGPLRAAGGLDCLGTEVAVAAGLVAVGWAALRRGAGSSLVSGLAAVAVAGALAADGALQLTCRTSGALAHVLVFHAGGVLLVAAAALLALRLRPQAA